MKKIKEFIKKHANKLVLICSLTLSFVMACSIMKMMNTAEAEKIETVTYNEFLSFVEKDEVDIVYYNRSEEYMTFACFNEETKDMPLEEREEYVYETKDIKRVLYPAHEDFRKELLESDVRIKLDEGSNTFIVVLSNIISLGLPILWLVIIFKMLTMQTKGLDKNQLIQTSDVKFSNVIGHDEILDDIKFITKLIQDPTIGDSVGAKVPKGILLSGDPGTGKTLIAKAIAGEAGVPFLYVNASSMIELFVGMGAKRVRDVFKIAKEHAPCIIFIDEIDSIGGKRDGRSGGHSEHEQTINALLQEMDGFSGRDGVFIIAATNRPDKLDSALTRAGRFDRQIVVNKPRDWKVRKDLFDYYLAKFKVSDDVDVEVLSKQVSGFTGADIAAICNEASIIAVMQEKEYIDNACIEEAIDKKIFKGNRSKEDHFKDDKRIVAYHEAGHAVMNYLTNQPISRASIIGTTSGVGGVVFGAETDSCFVTDKEMRDRVKVAYAGRASEEIKFKIVTTGASNDITQATHIMTVYIQRYGFDKEFGLLDMQVLSEQSILENSDITKRLSAMSKDLYKETLELLTEKYDLVEALAVKLLEIETMSGDEITDLFKEIENGTAEEITE